ncbi:MAG: rRNA maturation RNase YbeY [Acidobacteria bacterium]|nr:rRNA maturation RNase YbeY [Acidobacteriota bacterium]
MVEIVNNQRKIKIDAQIFREFAEQAAALIEETGGRAFVVAFVSDARMRVLNRDFRGKNATTDVLSFPFEPDEFEPAGDFLGDIVISTEQARRQAAENGLGLETEIRQLILHGILHLCGYDHETDNGEMNRRELELRQRLAIDQ